VPPRRSLNRSPIPGIRSGEGLNDGGPMHTLKAASVALVLASLVAVCPQASGAPLVYRIDHVVDGDTIALRNGQRVRLVQIDTPGGLLRNRMLRARRKDAPRDRALDEGVRARLPGRLRHRSGMGLATRSSPGSQPARGRVAPAGALPPPGRRRGRLPAWSGRPPTCSSPWSPAATNAARSSSPATAASGQWDEILGDAMVAAALIDRLVHHATMITLKGKSYRLRERGIGVAPAAQVPSLRDSA
jgi:IstB-like ATP binding protein